MLELKVENNVYKIEYSIEASLYDECVEKVTSFMCNVSVAEDNSVIKSIIKTLTDLPSTALSMLHAGLLEHHSVESGDGLVRTKEDTKKIIKAYIKEHKEDGKGNYYDILGMLIEQMEKDGFFDLIGLKSMIQSIQTTQEEVKKAKIAKK